MSDIKSYHTEERSLSTGQVLMRNYSYEEAVRVLKRDTRHFAKRQLTRFRREGEVTWVDKDNFDYDDSRILSYMLSVCREKGILPAK